MMLDKDDDESDADDHNDANDNEKNIKRRFWSIIIDNDDGGCGKKMEMMMRRIPGGRGGCGAGHSL